MIPAVKPDWQSIAYDCIHEVYLSHRDPDSSDYLKCEETPCGWCDHATIALEGLRQASDWRAALRALEAEMRDDAKVSRPAHPHVIAGDATNYWAKRLAALLKEHGG